MKEENKGERVRRARKRVGKIMKREERMKRMRNDDGDIDRKRRRENRQDCILAK